MKIYTIGFTNKKAEAFFSKLADAGVKRVIDVRLNNVSQLAGFSKRDDLRFFLRAINGIDYMHELLLAPTQPMLDDYKKKRESWEAYEATFVELLEQRKIENRLDPEKLADSCLLCSEDKPQQCHRRLVAEYLKRKWGGLEIVHIV